jgi:hypothetical protein
MRIRSHLRLLVIVSVAWILFWIAGLPDYYQQYSTKFMVFFDLAILPPIWLIVYRNIKKARPGKGFKISLWWPFWELRYPAVKAHKRMNIWIFRIPKNLLTFPHKGIKFYQKDILYGNRFHAVFDSSPRH